MTSGQKVTTDPETQRNPKIEGAGVVNSDSLAGESLASGGSFAANGASVASTNQPARSTTTNTTDTSSATTLQSAVNAQARLEREESSQAKAGKGNTGVLLGDNKPTGTVNAPQAHVQRSLPKGENLKEGGFDSDGPNASFTAEIGGKNDPGRKALDEAAAREGNGATVGAIGDRSGKITNDGQYDVLGDTSA